jgi:hypothetical protein
MRVRVRLIIPDLTPQPALHVNYLRKGLSVAASFCSFLC